MRLYSYYRSSAAYRVRIALGLKNQTFDIVPVDLFAQEQREDEYLAVNAQGLVPTLEHADGANLGQSMAILEWLEDRFPDPPLQPAERDARARYRALCLQIACDIHPLNNLRVLRYLSGTLGCDQEAVAQWYAHWIQLEFTSLEKTVASWRTPYSLRETPGLFEALLVPQVYNARRFAVDLTAFPALVSLDQRCATLPAFHAAHPHRQPDTPEELREA